MKAFIAVCMLALAAAEPEADPLLYTSYAGYHAPLAYSSYAAHPFTYSAYTGVYNPIVSRIYKREAEAEADPALIYSAGYHAPLAYAGYTGYANPWGFAGYSGLYSPYAARIYKREAEAEADPALVYSAGFQAPLAYTGYPFTYAAHPWSYAAFPGLKTYANDAIKPQNYAGKGQYVAASAGAVHVAKREAESDPLFYSAYAGAYAAPLAYPYTHAPLAYTASYPYAARYFY